MTAVMCVMLSHSIRKKISAVNPIEPFNFISFQTREQFILVLTVVMASVKHTCYDHVFLVWVKAARIRPNVTATKFQRIYGAV